MRAAAAARAILLAALLGGVAWAADPGREDFERGRRLVETNCADCVGATRQGLEDGVIALRQALAAGFAEPASVYRLLAEAYAALAQVYAKRDPDAVNRLTSLRRDALARLAALTPDQDRGRPAEAARETKPAAPSAEQRVAALSPPAPERCDAYRGRAVRGQAMELPLSGGLVFRLAPDAHGWTIGVIAAGRPDEDFAGIATPPYRGINARYLEGWHFRNQANTGPNQGDVNAPQHEREFGFVLTPADYRSAAHALDALLWGTRPESERRQLREILEQASRGRGRLRVTGSSLGNLVPGAQAWFEWMTFHVELCRTE